MELLNQGIISEDINDLVKLCYQRSKEAGWHDNPREVGTMIALIHSEVSEAMEGFRKDLMDDHLYPEPVTVVPTRELEALRELVKAQKELLMFLNPYAPTKQWQVNEKMELQSKISRNNILTPGHV